jgi:hypothetical protein
LKSFGCKSLYERLRHFPLNGRVKAREGASWIDAKSHTATPDISLCRALAVFRRHNTPVPYCDSVICIPNILVGLELLLRKRKVLGSNRDLEAGYIEIFRGFSHLLKANSWIILQMKSGTLLPSTSYPTDYSNYLTARPVFYVV